MINKSLVVLMLVLFPVLVFAQSPSEQLTSPSTGTPQISEEQQANIAKLKGDLATIKQKSQITEEQKQKLASDVETMLSGAVKPSQETIDVFVATLLAVIADGKLTNVEIAQLTKVINELLVSANVSSENFQAVWNDLFAILEASGISQEDTATIVADLRAIRAALNLPVPPPTPPAGQ